MGEAHCCPRSLWQKVILDKRGRGYFSGGALGLPRLRIVDSNPSVAVIFTFQSSLPIRLRMMSTGHSMRRRLPFLIDFALTTPLDEAHELG